jgi:hypothetical protein
VGKNILTPGLYLSILAGKIRKGINTPYMKAVKRNNIFANIADGSILT